MKEDMNKTKVSIIIPVFNEEKTIKRCVNSIVEQTLKDVEIIFCDDGSTDNTMQILQSLKEEYNNITILKQQNRGAGPARNRCLEIAGGEYICFMDADDYYIDRRAMELIYNAIVSNSLKIGCGLMQENNDNGEIIKVPLFRDIVEDNAKVVNFMDYQNDAFFQCYMIHRDVIVENKIEFPAFRRFQDPPFLVQCLHQAKEFVLVPVEFYFHQHDIGKVNFDNIKTMDMVRGMKWQLEFSLKHGYQVLTQKMLGRLNGEYYGSIIMKNLSNNYELLKLLIEINDLINEKGYALAILNKMVYNVSREDYVKMELQNRLKLNGKIIVYGAGRIGKKCVEAMYDIAQVEMIAVVDKNRAGEMLNSVRILAPSEIKKLKYDNILIAIENREIAQEVTEELVMMGISDKKVIYW